MPGGPVRMTPKPGERTDEPEGGHGIGILGNLARDVKDAAVNVPVGVYEAGRSLSKDLQEAGRKANPMRGGGDFGFERTRGLGTAIGKQYADTYGPLVRGDVGEFAHRVGQHPLGPILDAASVVSLGAGAGARGASALKAGSVKPLVKRRQPGPRAAGVYSRNPAAEGVQRLRDKRGIPARQQAKHDARKRQVLEAVGRPAGEKPHGPKLADMIGKGGVRAVDEINNAQKLAAVYLKPGYVAPQMMSNAFMVLTQQGFAAPRNLTHAARLDKRLGKAHAEKVDRLMGEGFVTQLAGEGQSVAGRASRWTAGKLGRVVDVPFRRASFLDEARRKGYSSPEQIRRLIDDPELIDDLVEVSTRANQQIVDFGELGPRERELVRRAVFVYPWVKGSTMYAGRFVRDKPVQADVYARLGEEGETRNTLGPVPSYLEGSWQAGGRLVNPTSFSPFSTPADVGEAVAGPLTGSKRRTGVPAGFATPALSFLTTLATGRNSFGRPHGGIANAARDEFFEGQPLVAVGRAALGKRQRSRLYEDSRQDVLLRYLIGGFYPRAYNRSELRKRAKRGD